MLSTLHIPTSALHGPKNARLSQLKLWPGPLRCKQILSRPGPLNKKPGPMRPINSTDV